MRARGTIRGAANGVDLSVCPDDRHGGHEIIYSFDPALARAVAVCLKCRGRFDAHWHNLQDLFIPVDDVERVMPRLTKKEGKKSGKSGK